MLFLCTCILLAESNVKGTICTMIWSHFLNYLFQPQRHPQSNCKNWNYEIIKVFNPTLVKNTQVVT